MAKRRIIWTNNADADMIEIMAYYAKRNKSKIYSGKLYSEIKQELKTLDFIIALPQKTKVEGLFYCTHKHISVFFMFQENNIIVKFLIDDRRNPESLRKLLEIVK
jgi:plasmid stabilization system protein ParE